MSKARIYGALFLLWHSCHFLRRLSMPPGLSEDHHEGDLVRLIRYNCGICGASTGWLAEQYSPKHPRFWKSR